MVHSGSIGGPQGFHSDSIEIPYGSIGDHRGSIGGFIGVHWVGVLGGYRESIGAP